MGVYAAMTREQVFGALAHGGVVEYFSSGDWYVFLPDIQCCLLNSDEFYRYEWSVRSRPEDEEVEHD